MSPTKGMKRRTVAVKVLRDGLPGRQDVRAWILDSLAIFRTKTLFGFLDCWTLVSVETGTAIYSTHRGMGEAREALEIVRKHPFSSMKEAPEEALVALKRLAKEGAR